MATLCEQCLHGEVCAKRCAQDEGDERAMVYCSHFASATDVVPKYEAIYALADMVNQFGYSTTFRRQKAVCDGGLSALEYAFGALADCGCKVNSNGSISLKNLFAFMEEIDAKIEMFYN